MWRSRLINSNNSPLNLSHRKDAISAWKKDEKCNKIFSLLIAWFGAREMCAESHLDGYWQRTTRERDRDKSYGTSHCSSTAVCLFWWYRGAPAACISGTKKRFFTRLTIEKSSHHKFIWMWKRQRKQKRCIHPLLTVMFPLVDDLPMKFPHKLRASAATIPLSHEATVFY